MERKKIELEGRTITLDISAACDGRNADFDEFQNWLDEQKQQVIGMLGVGESYKLDYTYNYDNQRELIVNFFRDETDEEYQHRVKRKADRDNNLRKAELKQLQYLKDKYENVNGDSE